jgi:hypothetical protein
MGVESRESKENLVLGKWEWIPNNKENLGSHTSRQERRKRKAIFDNLDWFRASLDSGTLVLVLSLFVLPINHHLISSISLGLHSSRTTRLSREHDHKSRRAESNQASFTLSVACHLPLSTSTFLPLSCGYLSIKHPSGNVLSINFILFNSFNFLCILKRL